MYLFREGKMLSIDEVYDRQQGIVVMIYPGAK